MAWLWSAFYEAKAAGLGPDPLREDADKERLWNVMVSSKRPVGLVLMDQAAVAGDLFSHSICMCM